MCFDPTYKGWKPDFNEVISTAKRALWSYLQGMETESSVKRLFVEQALWSYLQGMETSKSLSTCMMDGSLWSYLQGMETRVEWGTPPSLGLLWSYLQGMETNGGWWLELDWIRFDPTYKGWKLEYNDINDYVLKSFDPTYKGWKPKKPPKTKFFICALILPTRDGNKSAPL